MYWAMRSIIFLSRIGGRRPHHGGLVSFDRAGHVDLQKSAGAVPECEAHRVAPGIAHSSRLVPKVDDIAVAVEVSDVGPVVQIIVLTKESSGAGRIDGLLQKFWVRD